MKFNTLFFILFAIIFAGCSKKSTESDPETKPPIDTTLAGRLNLKITDKENLILSKKIFEDSKGNSVIEGTKSGKHWLGCFDKSGNEILVKTYTSDSTTFTTRQGIRYPIKYNRYQQIEEINGSIVIVRQLSIDTSQYYRFNYIQDFTKINLPTKKITNEYTKIEDGKDYIFKVTNWYGDFYRISIYRYLDFREQLYLTTIYNGSDEKVAEFLTFTGESSITDYVAVSNESFVNIRLYGGTGVLQCWDYQKTRIFYERHIFEKKYDDEIKIDSFQLVNGVIEIKFTITNSKGVEESTSIKLDASTGTPL